MGELVKKSVYIRDDQAEWVEDNESFNFSGWVREELDEEIPESEG